MAIGNEFSKVEQHQYKHRIGKKMGFAATGLTQGSVLSPSTTKTNQTSGVFGDRDTQSFSSAGNLPLKSLAPNAGKDVVNAWYEAAGKTGVNGFDGSDTQLSALYALQAEQRKTTGSSDVLGKTKGTAAAAVKKAVSKLESMMENETVNTKVQEYREKEMSFYREFLGRLEA